MTPSARARIKEFGGLAVIVAAFAAGLTYEYFTRQAYAQEAYTVNASAGQVSDLQQYTLSLNRALCRTLNLAVTCTQAQACTAGNAAGGASCTASQARAANVRIWPDTLAGREEYNLFFVAAPKLVEIRNLSPITFVPGPAMGDYCVWWTAQNATTRNAECSKVGAPNGCSVCQ